MTCGRIKASAITRSVLGSFLQQKVVSDLKEVYYFAISSDASNVGNIKTFPYAAQYFHERNGICQKLLDFYEDPNETSNDIFQCLQKITVAANLKTNQISTYSTDNASMVYSKHNSFYQKCYVRRTRTTLFFRRDLKFIETLKFYLLSFFFSTLKTKTRNPVSPRECRSEIKINNKYV